MKITVPDYLDPSLELKILNGPGEVRSMLKAYSWEPQRLFDAYKKAAKEKSYGIISDGCYLPDGAMAVIGIGWDSELVYLRGMLVEMVPLALQPDTEIALPRMIGDYLMELMRQKATGSIGKFGIGLKFFDPEDPS